MGERVYVEGLEPRPIGPDVWVRQTGRELSIEILDRESGMRVVTVIELVSPSNRALHASRSTIYCRSLVLPLGRNLEFLKDFFHFVSDDLVMFIQRITILGGMTVPARYCACQERFKDLLPKHDDRHDGPQPICRSQIAVGTLDLFLTNFPRSRR